MATKETKERILDAAEQLLAEHGFGGTSVRGIASEADVNLASINYHFGSKEALIQAVFERRVGPVNEERLRLLDQLEQAAGDRPLPVEGITEAFVHPALGLRSLDDSQWRVLQRLLGHTISLPSGKARDAFLEQFSEVVRRFTIALGRALPDLTPQEVVWRFFFMVGTLVQTLAMAEDMPRISHGLCGETDAATTQRWLVPFIAAGLRAPAAEVRLETNDA